MKTTILNCPNATTKDDHDLYLEITATTQWCEPIDLQFHHVQGHQDTKANRPLTIPEQLNVECDKRAKQYVMTTPIKSTTYGNPALPTAQPHLRIGGKIICRKVHCCLRHQIATPTYYSYLQKKFTWNSHELTHIHWMILGSSLDSFNPSDQRCLVHFLNGKLPLHDFKAHPHLGSHLCPSCQREPEDKRHFLQCNQPEQTAKFEEMKANLTTLTQNMGLHPCLATSLWLGLRTIRNGSNYPDIIQDLPYPLQGAIQKQSRLGWDQLYYGRITTTWANAIDEMHLTLKLTGTQVMTKIVRIIWESVLEQWKVRNHHLHQNAAELDHPNYQQAITTLYEQRHQLPPAAQEALYRQPLEVILDQPAPRLQKMGAKRPPILYTTT